MASGREIAKKAPSEGLRGAEKSSIQDFYPKYRIFSLGKYFKKFLTVRFFFYNACEVFIVNMFSKLRKDDVYGRK